MFGKPVLFAVVLGASLVIAAAAGAQQGGTPSGKPAPKSPHSAHVGNDVCKTHPNLPQCS